MSSIDSPPPPYSEVDNMTRAPSYSEPVAPANPTRAPAARSVSGSLVNIPGVITAYWPKRNLNTEFCLGETPDKLLFRVDRGKLSDRGPVQALYIGPGTNILSLGRLDQISYLPFNGHVGTIEITTPRNLEERSTVNLRYFGGLHPIRWCFSMAVPDGPQQRVVEQFEWRSSRGREIRAIDPGAEGYKLVRMRSTGGHGGRRNHRAIGESSDGKEIVAVWLTNHAHGEEGKTPFKFQLLESGRDGILGKHFGFVALMSALRIWMESDSTIPPARPAGPRTTFY
ncbi:hypothetical protein F4818DRAFT_410255 [Hypoxylon cercidicola]|nr:hypothetical protein F4818DRAFT_410255 [Hypoxylon cercidicola]